MKNILKLLIIISASTTYLAADAFYSYFLIQASPLDYNYQAQATPITGTKVKLVPPVNFTPSSQFSGYVQESTGSSIVVTEFPASFTEVSASLSESEQLAQKNLILLNQQEVTLNQQQGKLFQLQQKAYGQEYLKWILVFGDEQETVLITATLPKVLESALSESLKASLLSAEWDKTKIVSPTEGLNFAVVEAGNLKLAQRLGNTILYSKEGVFPSPNIDDPIFIVGQSLGQAFVSDRETFSRNRLQETASVTAIQVEELQKVVINELEGYEIIAQGKDNESKQPMLIYQTILFVDDNTYYIMQGIVSFKSKNTSLANFKLMANSFKRIKINP